MKFFLIYVFIPALLSTNSIYGQKFEIDKKKENLAQFFAEATFNSFDGTTKSIEGYIILDAENKISSVFDFKVRLDSLDTGIGLRNKHLRTDLNTSKFPFAEFKGTPVVLDSMSISEYNIRAEGYFTIKGITKRLVVHGIFYDLGELKKIETNFSLKLSDYNIDRPSFLFNKVHDLIKTRVIIYLKKSI